MNDTICFGIFKMTQAEDIGDIKYELQNGDFSYKNEDFVLRYGQVFWLCDATGCYVNRIEETLGTGPSFAHPSPASDCRSSSQLAGPERF